MIELTNFEVMGWDHAIRGMRNPMNSWDKSDSYWTYVENPVTGNKAPFQFFLGEADHELMIKLAKSGSDHAKYRRMIAVYVDILAPLYWWKEFDTYKVGTVANSCSTMHKIHDKELNINDFSHEHLNEFSKRVLNTVISSINLARDDYLKNDTERYEKLSIERKDDWWQMIQSLPSSYNQKRTVMLNYEVLANIYKSRKNHKLNEWREFCEWIESLPYSDIITLKED